RNFHYADIDEHHEKDMRAEWSSGKDPLVFAALSEMKSFIDETFNRMSEKQGIVVRLHDMEGYTIQEIADILGCPAGTAKSRLFYGRQEFKAIYTFLTKDGSGPFPPSCN
ncbi:MAG TPA: RNA polymerase sigma factor, partial [Acidobacteriota bacterium]|nr:RNA polymerase sigma factor [Acidobacteriota bacterium]